MQGDVWHITYHPTIVTGRSGWNIKEHPSAKFVDRAVLHRSRGTAGEHQPHMLDVAARRTHAGPDVNGPLPSWLVGGAADGHAPDANEFEFPFSNVRTSSGSSKRFRTVSSIGKAPSRVPPKIRWLVQ